MKRVSTFTFLLVVLLTSTLQAQNPLSILYEVVAGPSNTDTVHVYFRNNQGTNLLVSAANIAIVYRNGDSYSKIAYSLFEDEYGNNGTNINILANLAVLLPQTYEGASYTSRFYYTAGKINATDNISIPPNTANPLKVLSVVFDLSGTGSGKYIESAAEFPGQQVSDENVAVIAFDRGNVGSPYPVEWLGFEAEQIAPATVELDWITATEQNNAEFLIERSFDGAFFEGIGTVAGAGNSSTASEYKYVDFPVENPIAFYRLRQVDIDGRFSYSEVRQVVMDSDFGYAVQVFPNPAVDFVNISSSAGNNHIYELTITDMSGRVIHKVERAALGADQISVNVKELPTGMYMVDLLEKESDKRFSTMFIKK